MHLAVLRAFKKICDDGQKIYSRKIKNYKAIWGLLLKRL